MEGFLPDKASTSFWIIGILVEPPTNITSSISFFVRPASLSAFLTGSIDLLTSSSESFSNLALVRVVTRCFGPEDVAVIQVGKTADFQTASQMTQNLERRIGEAFMQLNVRQSERTTAEEVRLTQMELEQQLGGLFSLLTVEFLIPYLNRTLLVLQRSKQIPTLPKDLARPTIVAGVNALVRGQDRES